MPPTLTTTHMYTSPTSEKLADRMHGDIGALGGCRFELALLIVSMDSSHSCFLLSAICKADHSSLSLVEAFVTRSTRGPRLVLFWFSPPAPPLRNEIDLHTPVRVYCCESFVWLVCDLHSWAASVYIRFAAGGDRVFTPAPPWSSRTPLTREGIVQ